MDMIPMEFEDKISDSQLKYIEVTLDSSSLSTSLNYPTGEDRYTFVPLTYRLYRNAQVVFAPAVNIINTNSNIVLELKQEYSYFQGCPILIYYA